MQDQTDSDDQIDHSRRAVLAALATTGAAAAGGRAASAQDQDQTDTPTNSTSSTSTRTETSTPTPTGTEEISTEPGPGEVATEIEEQISEEPTYLAQVDSTLRILDYSTADLDRDDNNQQTARVTATVEADVPQALTLTDAFGAFASRGVNKIRERSEAVSEGKTRVGIRCTVVRGMVGMGLSTDQGGVGISSGAPEDGGTDVRLALGVGVGAVTAVSGTAAAAWRKLNDHKDEPESVFEEES